MSGLRVEVLRGDRVESVHDVDLAAVDGSGRARMEAGDPERSVFARSAIKPFQALPLVEEGVLERLGLGDEALAVCCASHSGEPRHLAVSRAILDAIGLTEEALACGAHRPFDDQAARALDREGAEPSRLHNNCSGKHGGMLALAWASGWAAEGYHRPEHPVQRRMLAELSRWTEVPEDRIETAVDGCGVVTFAAPVRALALAFARLAGAGREPGTPAARVLDAMGSHPFLVAGTGRLCTRIAELTGGRVLAKVGAEGVYGALEREAGVGITLKVRDGAKRAAEVALLGALESLGLLSDEELAALRKWAGPELRNTRGEVVGSIRAVQELGALHG